MRLLILGNWHALSNAVQYAKAFRQEGHEVVTCGSRFTREDGRRWKKVLLGMEWPPSDDEAEAYVAQVVAESPPPTIETGNGVWVPWQHYTGRYDAIIVFDAYNETPLLTHDVLALPIPCALVCGDTHTGGLARQVKEANLYNHVFVQFRRADLDAFDHPSTHWLPPAADPVVWVHVPDAPKDYDVLFVGATDPHVHTKRVELLHFLKRELGDERVVVKHLFGERAALAMNRARVVLNCSLAGDLNMRVPEALCTGAVLVTDDVDGLDDLGAGDWWSYWGTRAPGAALEIVRALLAKPDRLDVRLRARATVLERHTYRHRVRQILGVLFGEKANGGPDGGPDTLGPACWGRW